MGHGPPPSGLLGIFPMPTLLLPHCCFNMVGGRPPAHSRGPPHSLSLSPWGKVLPPDLTTLTSQRTASPLARLCREEGGVWLCAHPRLSSPADGYRCLCACRDKGQPCHWLPGTRAHGFPGAVCWSWNLEASALCCWGSPCALSWLRTPLGLVPVQNQHPDPSGLRAVGAVMGRPVSALCLRALREKERVSLNYVFLRKEFCSERQAGQMCRFCASRGKTKQAESLADCITVCL